MGRYYIRQRGKNEMTQMKPDLTIHFSSLANHDSGITLGMGNLIEKYKSYSIPFYCNLKAMWYCTVTCRLCYRADYTVCTRCTVKGEGYLEEVMDHVMDWYITLSKVHRS